MCVLDISFIEIFMSRSCYYDLTPAFYMDSLSAAKVNNDKLLIKYHVFLRTCRPY